MGRGREIGVCKKGGWHAPTNMLYYSRKMETKAKDERRTGACGGYRAPRRPLGRARARSEASVCVQVPPPPLFAGGAVGGFYAAFPGRRDCGPYQWAGTGRRDCGPYQWVGTGRRDCGSYHWVGDGPQGLRSLPIFGAVSDGTAADCFSLSSSSQQRSLAGTPGVFVRETQVNPQKQQKGNKKQ